MGGQFADKARTVCTNLAPGSLGVWLTAGGSTADARDGTLDRGAEGRLRGMARGCAVAADIAGSALAYPRQVP